ncbi:MAG: peptidase M28, partial [Candidatus Gracilibacteria bacterium]|nr:peptidase M28 [Candidatus Gracilibacteria bacterium]
EMIGYFSPEKIQKFPIGFLKYIYPETGDFIALVAKIEQRGVKQIKKSMREYSLIDTWSLNAPRFITQINLSDHKNYWDFGYTAYMVTDTSFLRNSNYHTPNDTIDTLDFEKMSEVVRGVYGAIINYK